MTYRSRYQNELQPSAIVDLLVSDELNPRAIKIQLQRLVRDMEQFPQGAGTLRSDAEKLAIKLLAAVRVFETGGKSVDGTPQPSITGATGNEAFQHLSAPQALREWN